MKKVLQSFGFAFKGVWTAIYTQRNLRIHICCMLYMYGFLLCFDFFKLTRAELAIILVANALVIVLEMVNTAVEAVVDLVTDEFATLAKIAKDVAAGAVLAAVVCAVLVGLVLLFQPEAFSALFNYYKEKPFTFVLFIASFDLTIPFVLVFGEKQDSGIAKDK